MDHFGEKYAPSASQMNGPHGYFKTSLIYFSDCLSQAQFPRQLEQSIKHWYLLSPAQSSPSA